MKFMKIRFVNCVGSAISRKIDEVQFRSNPINRSQQRKSTVSYRNDRSGIAEEPHTLTDELFFLEHQSGLLLELDVSDQSLPRHPSAQCVLSFRNGTSFLLRQLDSQSHDVVSLHHFDRVEPV
jgi:hypothetical protein